MPKLTYRTSKQIAKRTFGKVTVASQDEKGHMVLKETTLTYPAYFDYGTVEGFLMLRKDHTMIQLLNDYLPSGRDPECADREDLNSFIKHMELQGLTDTAGLAVFLREEYGELFGGDYLVRLARGIRFSEAYPLQISTPEADFKKLLLRRGSVYTWRREYWDVVGEEIDIATFAPLLEPHSVQ